MQTQTFPKVYTDIIGFCPEIAQSLVQTHREMATSSEEFFSLLHKEFGLLLSTDEYDAHRQDLPAFLASVLQKRLEELRAMAISPEQAQLARTQIYLGAIDKYWIDHIDDMQRLREKVGLMGYAQIDPLIVYKKEAFEKYQTLLLTIKQQTLTYIFAHAAQALSEQSITFEDDGSGQLVQKLKGVASQMKNAKQSEVQQSREKGKMKNTMQQSGPKVLQQSDDFDVIEMDEETSSSSKGSVIDLGKKKLRPNDKVTVQYQNGTFEYDVKYKKVEADVEAGKCRIVG